jgi:MSHA pilin protein MshA
LIVVIVILGIVAAVAIPRYMSYITDARRAAIHALAGAVRSSVALVQSQYVAKGQTTSPVTLADGTNVVVTTGKNGGIPTVAAAGIGSAVSTDGSFAFVPATGVWNFQSGPIENCNATYTASGTVSIDTTGC